MKVLERIAFNWNLRYKKLNDKDGNIAIATNGAGFSLATQDLVDHYGGKAANFLNLPSDSVFEDMIEALRLFQWDKRVKVILLNWFGGLHAP